MEEKKPKRRKIHTEKAVDRALKRVVEEAGGMIFKMHPTTNAGVPDRLVHLRTPRMTFYVELKRTGERCTELQIEVQRRLKGVGILTYVLDQPIENVYDIFELAYTTFESRHYHKNPHKDL